MDAGYAYVLLPGKSAAETAAYAEDPDIEILKNDGTIHAARDNSQNILAANFWQAGSLEYITVSAPASVIVQRDGDRLTVGVSDPTQRDVPITVTLAMTGELVGKDDAVTLDNSSPLLRFTVDTTEDLGGTYTATFQVEETSAVELMSVAGNLAPVEAQPGTAFYDLALPKTAVFSASDGKEYTLDLVWSRGGYNTDAYNMTFVVTAEPVLPEGILNHAGVRAEAEVKVQGPEAILATGDTYVNDGNSANTNYSAAGTLHVKLDNTSYQREALFRFDISNVPDGADRYLFQVAASMDDGFLGGELHLVDNNWDPATVTWNSKPARNGTAAAADETTCYEGTRSAGRSQAVVKADRAAITANIHGEKANATDNSDGRIVGFPTDDGMIYEYKLSSAADTAENWHTVSGAQVTVAAGDYMVRIQATATHNASATRNLKVGTYDSTMNPVKLDETMRNGSVIRNQPQADKGDTVTLTINPATGYELDTITHRHRGQRRPGRPQRHGQHPHLYHAGRGSYRFCYLQKDQADHHPRADRSEVQHKRRPQPRGGVRRHHRHHPGARRGLRSARRGGHRDHQRRWGQDHRLDPRQRQRHHHHHRRRDQRSDHNGRRRRGDLRGQLHLIGRPERPRGRRTQTGGL